MALSSCPLAGRRRFIVRARSRREGGGSDGWEDGPLSGAVRPCGDVRVHRGREVSHQGACSWLRVLKTDRIGAFCHSCDLGDRQVDPTGQAGSRGRRSRPLGDASCKEVPGPRPPAPHPCPAVTQLVACV